MVATYNFGSVYYSNFVSIPIKLSIGLNALSLSLLHSITFDLFLQIQRTLSVAIENAVGYSFLSKSFTRRSHGCPLDARWFWCLSRKSQRPRCVLDLE